jgi:hypothetical protein
MSFVPSTVGTNAAIAAAQAHAAELRKEEEQMTLYTGDDLEGWEFKIVRATTRKFKRREVLQRVCAEEARNGWEMLEKFDDSRIRFKRRVDRRAADGNVEIDPYRSQVGISPGGVVMLIVGISVALVALLVGFAIYFG